MRHAAPVKQDRIRGPKRVGRRLWMMAAVLVLAGSVIVATERAGAQSNTPLVSNLDKHRPGSQLAGTASDFNDNDEVAAAFTTGTDDHGYGLASVTVELASSTQFPGTPVPEFTIRSNSNGSPGPVLFTLDNPSNIGSINISSSRFTFNAPSRTELAPNTTYWLVAYATDAVLLNGYTEILDEDAGKKPGWSIGDALFTRDRDSNSAWDSEVDITLKMKLDGVVLRPDVGQLALYWLDQSGQQDHPVANGNLLQLQYCRGTLPFMVYFHGNMDHRDIDEWDVDIRPRRGVVGDVTYGFREQTDANDGFHQMFGRVTFDDRMSMTIKIRARDGNTWGPWSPPSGLYCREVPRVANITTSRGQIINEGDSFTFDVAFDKPMQLDTDLTLRLTRSTGSYPKFTGGLGEKTITVRRGQSEVSLDMRSIDDDIRSIDRDITLEIVRGTGYRAGHRNAVSFQILDGSYGPELDADDIPTGNIVFNREADTVTRSFPRCGEGSDSTATNRVGLVEVREDAGTIQVPVHTIAGGTDFVHNYIILNMQGTATREDDYNAPAVVTFQPLAETTLIDVEILDSPELEDTQSFRLTLLLNAFTAAQHLFDCQEVEIIIEDDDTADTTIRIADGADAAFTDFVGREARVTEGNTIKLEVSLAATTGQCIVPFLINAWTTASGDVSVIDQGGFTTNNGTQSGLGIPPCTRADEMHVPTVQTAGDQGTKTVYFDIAPVADERIFLEGGRETVRYTVHIDDSEAGSQQVEADTIVDETPPQLQSATVDGSSLTLAYDETLDSVSVPNSAFAVNVNGSPRPVMVVAVGQSNVLLFLSAPVEAGDAVTVDYTVPTQAAGRVQDTSGNAAESFSGRAVTNNTTSSGDGDGGSRSDEQDPPGVPQGLDVALQQSGKLKATWKAPGSGPAPTGYTVQWKAAVDAWEDPGVVSETDVTKTSYVVAGLTDGTEYAVRVIATTDDADSDPSGEVTATPAETTPPELSSATVDGATLTLAYDEQLDIGETPDRSAFAVTVAGNGRGVDTVAVSGSAVTLTLVTAVEAGDAVTVAYTAPTDDATARLQDLVGNAAASFSGQEVTNNTAPDQTEEPSQTEEESQEQADIPGSPTGLQVTRHESGKLLASWTAPDSGPAPTRYTVQWKESGDDWADRDDVSEADVTGASHIIAGLTDGTEYAVRVIATTDDAESDPSVEVAATPAETTPPELSSATVDGATLTLTFDEPLDIGEAPDRSAFAVAVAGNGRSVDTVAVSGSMVILTLVTAVSAGDTVTVAYTAPTDDATARLQDLVGNAAASFSWQSVTNDTQAAARLTAGAHDVPAAHDGSTTFTFELRFSETPRKGFSYKTLRDHAFTVTSGDVTKARRLEKGKNVRWEISVTPDVNGTVTIVLPVSTDCTAQGAICTQDGRMLSNPLEITVPGPGG